MRLERVAATWRDYGAAQCNERFARYHSHVEKSRKTAHARYVFEQKYWIPWGEQARTLDRELDVIVQKWKAGGIVTPADWDATTVGKERKAICIIDVGILKKYWPPAVRERFPNVIALLLHLEQDQLHVEHEKQYATAVESIANEATLPAKQTLLEAYYKEQCYEIVKHFAQQRAETMELKCSAGDTSDGVGSQTTMTLE